MSAKQYWGDLIGGGLLLGESRLVAGVLLNDFCALDWRNQFMVDNILKKTSHHTSLRYAQTIRKRLDPLGKEFIQTVVMASGLEYKQLILLATLIHSPILADFMSIVIKDHKRLYKSRLSLDAWDVFINEKLQLAPHLAVFSASTSKKIGTNVVRILVESGYLNSNHQREFQPIYILPETRKWILNFNRHDLEDAIECTV